MGSPLPLDSCLRRNEGGGRNDERTRGIIVKLVFGQIVKFLFCRESYNFWEGSNMKNPGFLKIRPSEKGENK